MSKFILGFQNAVNIRHVSHFRVQENREHIPARWVIMAVMVSSPAEVAVSDFFDSRVDAIVALEKTLAELGTVLSIEED